MSMILLLLRSEGDSNPRYAFGVYSLSRRANSATLASLQILRCKDNIIFYFYFCCSPLNEVVSNFLYN